MTTQQQSTIARQLAEFAAGIRLEEIPAPVIERAKLHILDTLGVALASSVEDFAHRAVSAVTGLASEGAYPVIGFPHRLPIRDAVVLNGAMIHGIDFDDTHAAGVLHGSASSLPMALAAAQSINGTGKDVLLAYLIAQEVSSRVAAASRSGFHQNGFHPTGMCAPFGCVLGIGRLWGLTVQQMTHAQGLVLSMASGSFEFLEDGAWNKRLHPGWAVAAAFTACSMAKNGFIGATKTYEGRYGLYNAFLGERKNYADLSLCTAGLGVDWEMLNVSLKPYPVCHYNHAFVDAALKLRKEHGIEPDQIESVRAFISENQTGVVCEPLANKRRPRSTYDARFSLPFALSAALGRGRLTMDEVSEELIGDAQILQLCDRVSYVVDPNSAFPRHYSGTLEITLKGGRTVRHAEPINRGHPDNPLSREDVIAKFQATASRAVTRDKFQKLAEATLALDSAGSAQAFAAALASPSAR